MIHDCAMQGHLPAIYDLGANFYYNGVRTEKNLKLSEYYLKMYVKIKDFMQKIMNFTNYFLQVYI